MRAYVNSKDTFFDSRCVYGSMIWFHEKYGHFYSVKGLSYSIVYLYLVSFAEGTIK